MLVVEDSPTIVSVVKYFLELEGFEVLVAEDGLVGLEMALREHPGRDRQRRQHARHGRRGDGEGAARRPAHRQVRILMLTSESSVESETEGPGRRRRRLHSQAGGAAASRRAREGAAEPIRGPPAARTHVAAGARIAARAGGGRGMRHAWLARASQG